MKIKSFCAFTVFIAALAAPSYAAPVGPTYPAPGGNDFASTGGPGAQAGGVTWSYSNFDVSGLSALYFGLDQLNGPVGAGLSGTADPFSNFDGVSGTVATWSGTTTWYDHQNGTNPSTVATRLTITITGLGSTPWVTDLASIGLDSGFGDLGAVVDNSSGSDFSMHWAVESDADGGWKALNDVRQHSSRDGQTITNFGTGFYYEEASAVPEINGAQLGIALTLLLSLVLLYREREGFQA